MASKLLGLSLFIVLASGLSISLMLLGVRPLYSLQSTFRHYRSSGTGFLSGSSSPVTDVCRGHYYLCRVRDILTKSTMYNRQVQLDSHIYNFSNATGFRTKFFKVHPNIEFGWGQKAILTLQKIREFMRKEFPQKWYTHNLIEFSNPNGKVLNELCTFKFDKSARYVTSSKGFIGSGWPGQVLFQVNETIISRVPVPNLIPYSDVYAIVSTSNTIAFCKTESYLDLGNMTQYSLTCPIVEDNFTVEIKSAFITGSLYDRTCNPVDNDHGVRQVYTQVNFTNLPISKKLISALPACLSSTTQHVPGFWMHRKDIWHWSTHKCYFPITLNKKLENCLSKTNMIMFGDSHARDRSNGFKKHFQCNLTYVQTAIASHLLFVLRQHEPMLLNLTQPTAIMFNSGQWSFCETDPLSYMSDMLGIVNLIKYLKRKSSLLKFIWVETLPVPYSRARRRRFGENNIIAAMNDFVSWNMERIGVPVIKTYDLAISVSGFATRDGCHYHELFGQDAIKSKKTLSVGGAITAVLIRTICN